MRQHYKEGMDLLYAYENLTGERWPKFNYKESQYSNLREWFDALKNAVEAAKAGKEDAYKIKFGTP